MKINKEIATIFNDIADILEILDENPFKIRAYRNASRNISSLNEDVANFKEQEELKTIKGIGRDLSEKIHEYIETGSIEYYETVRQRVPDSIKELLSIRGIGPKFVSNIFQNYNVQSVEDLEELLRSEKASEIKGLGKKKIKELRENLSHHILSRGNINIGIALPLAEQLVADISRISRGAKPAIAGSVRRMKETVQNIDIVCIKDIDLLDKLAENGITENVVSAEDEEISFSVGNDVKVNLRIADETTIGSQMIYFTGPREHNEVITDVARRNGFDFGKKGLSRGDEPVRAEDERDVYKRLGLQFIDPELREDELAFQMSENGSLPELISDEHIKGDLHTHSTWSDGTASVRDMVNAAAELGYKYIAITDHSASSVIANGLDVKRLLEKKKEIEKIDGESEKIKVLMGAEVDIKRDGSLDYPDDILSELDIVVASVHSNFKLDREEMTERIMKALKNPFVHILGHPTGRLIGDRKPYDIDMDRIMDTAREHGKALEVNSSWKRLDLKDSHIKKALEKGIILAVSTDAHSTEQLSNIRYGIGTLRRAIATPGNVLNTMDTQNLLSWLNGFK